MQELEAICQCQAGDLAALGVLFELHNQTVLRTAYGIVHNYDLAEDVTQEVFIDLPTSIKRFDKQRPFSPWLHTVVVRRSLNALGRGRDRNVPIDGFVDLPSPDLSPEAEAEQSEMEAEVWAIVETLDLKHRAVVVLFYYHGFNEAEISKVLGCRRGTVKSRLHYARALLRKLLPPTEPGEPGVANPISVPPYGPTGPGIANPTFSRSREVKTTERAEDRLVAGLC